MNCADCGRPVLAKTGRCDNCGAWSLDLGFPAEASQNDIPVYRTQADADARAQARAGQAYPRMTPTADPAAAFASAPPPMPGSIPGSPMPGATPGSAAPFGAAAPGFPPPAPGFAPPAPGFTPPAAPGFGAFPPPPVGFAPPTAPSGFTPPVAPTMFAPPPGAPTGFAPTAPPTIVVMPSAPVEATDAPEHRDQGEVPTVGVSLLWGPPKAADRVYAPAPVVDSAADSDDDFEETRMVRRDVRTRMWALTLPDDSVEIILRTAIVGRVASPVREHPGASLISVTDPSRSVSKNHAVFADVAGILTVEDLHSTNGIVVTRADGIQFALRSGGKAELDEGSVVELGQFSVKVHKLNGPDLGS